MRRFGDMEARTATRKYLYEARDDDGNPVSGYVEAASSAGAREALAAARLRDVRVIDDDHSAEIRAISEREGADPDARVDLLARYDPSPWGLALIAMRKNAVWIAAGVALAAYCLYAGWWLFGALVAAGVIALPAFPAWVQWQQNQMHRSFWNADYARSERIARRLRGMKLYAAFPSIHAELDARIAGARVMQGDLAGALAALAPWEGSEHVPATTHLLRVANVHFLARDFGRYLEIMELVHEKSPEADYARIDLGQVLARIGDDDARARKLLASVDPSGLGHLHLAFIGLGRGVLALRGGRDEEALRELAHANDAMHVMADNPITWGSLAIATGYLCVAMARSGRADRAKELLEGVRPLVERHAEDRLLAWLRVEGLAAPTRSGR